MLVTVHVSAGGCVALETDSAGRVVHRGRGTTAADAVADLGSPPSRIVAADEARAPRGAAVGVIDMISLESAIRALRLAGADVVAEICVNEDRTEAQKVWDLRAAGPEIVLLVGGTDGGDEAHLGVLAGIVALATREDGEETAAIAPHVVYAGNPEAWEIVTDALGEAVEGVANVRPACERENLAPAVVRLTIRGTTAIPVTGRAPVAAAPAGAARSAAVWELARRRRQRTLLLADVDRGGEAVSHLGDAWNRVAGATLEDAVALHRETARELGGVPLLREISDAFARYERGRDLLDVAPPELILGAGPRFRSAAPRDALAGLVDLARPRGVVRIGRIGVAEITLLGLAAIDGRHPEAEAFDAAVEDLGIAVCVDGPGDDVLVDLPRSADVVEAGGVRVFELDRPGVVRVVPQGAGDVGRGRAKPVLLDLPTPPGLLLVDARGTPVPPERRPRILAR